MPLGKIFKISLIHKENTGSYKVSPGICQEVPQNTSCGEGIGQRIKEKRTAGASLTVEAALVFPIFLFVMVGMLFLFRIMQVNLLTERALAETGSWLSLAAGTEYGEDADGNSKNEELSLGLAIAFFHKELAENNCPTEYIIGDKLGILWTGTDLDGEYVDLQIQYFCKFPISFPRVRIIPISQRVRMKKWTGWDWEENLEQQEDSWVYITPNGEVYHRSMECTHLRLSIRAVNKNSCELQEYTPCLLCGNKQQCAYYYITEEGKRYHTELECSGLKRTVYMIRLSEAGGRAACSRCGNGI